MHSWWVRIPALIIGIIILLVIGLYGVFVIMDNIDSRNRQGRKKKPVWLGLLCICIFFSGLASYLAASDEQRVIADFAAWFATNMLFCGILVGGMTGAYLAGNRIHKKTEKYWLASTVGIVIASVIYITAYLMSSQIPGVDWRMEMILEEMSDDEGGSCY